MAAPSWSHEYTAEASSNAASLVTTVNGSSEFAEGDLILVFSTTDGGVASSLGTSGGISNLIKRYAEEDIGSGNDVTIGCFTKELESGDISASSVTVSWTGSEKACVAIYRIPKNEHNGLIGVPSATGNSASSTPDLPAITLTSGNHLVFGQVAMDGNVSVSVNPTGYSTTEDHSASGGSNCSQWIGEDVLGGPQSANGLTLSNTRNNCTGIIAVMEYELAAWLVESWELDEASGNATGSHDSHTLTDNNTVGSDTGKVYSLARDFDASASEFLSLANASAGDFDPGTGNWAVSCWVKPESGHTGTDGIMSYGGDGPSSEGYRIGWNADNDVTIFVADGTDFHSYDSSPEFTDGVFAHLIVNFNRVDGVTAWVDNVVTSIKGSGLGNLDGDDLTPSDDFRVGRSRGADYVDGLIGPLRIWNQCLAKEARDALYASGNGLTYSAITGVSIPIGAITRYYLTHIAGS